MPLTLGSGGVTKSIMTSFTVIEAPSSYNIILGRPTMGVFKAVASTYHQKIKFPVGNRIGVKGNQPSSRKCYAETIRVDRKRARRGEKSEVLCLEPVQDTVEKEQEDVPIVSGQSDKVTKVARDLDVSIRPHLLAFLEKNADIFAWSSSELVGISTKVAEHKLNIIPGSRPIKQKKRHFGPEKDEVISRQVATGGTFTRGAIPT